VPTSAASSPSSSPPSSACFWTVVGAEAQQDTVPAMNGLNPSPLLALSAPDVAILIRSVNEHPYSSREYTLYSLYAITHDVDGKFLVKATDEDINDLLKEMSMTAAHKVELRNAISSWRSDPQQTTRILENARNAAAAAAAAEKLKTEREAALQSEQDALDFIENAKRCRNVVLMLSGFLATGLGFMCIDPEKDQRNRPPFWFFLGFWLIGTFVCDIFVRVLFKIVLGEKFSFFPLTVFGGGF
jgi:hypothetical protein